MKTTYLTALSWLRLAGEFLEKKDLAKRSSFLSFVANACLSSVARKDGRKQEVDWKRGERNGLQCDRLGRDAERQRHLKQDANHDGSGSVVWTLEVVTARGLGLARPRLPDESGRGHSVAQRVRWLRTAFDGLAILSIQSYAWV